MPQKRRTGLLARVVIAILALALLIEILLILDVGGLATRIAHVLEPDLASSVLPDEWEGSGGDTAHTQNPPYKVFFTTPRYPGKGESHRGGLDVQLTALIGAARTSVDGAIFQLDLPNVTRALLDASARGVVVRIVTDVDTLSDSEENSSFLQLIAGGIAVVGGNSAALMHDKFVIVDGAYVWTGSWNFTTADTYRYNNNALIIRSSELARNYTVAFERMFVAHRFGAAKTAGGTTARLDVNGIVVESYFSPEDKPADKIMARLRQAQQSIYFMAFSFTHDGIGQAVRGAWQAGLIVQGVLEAGGTGSEFSEWSELRAMGMDVVLDGNPYLMHHKIFIIDEQTVVMGSMNFSDNANRENDENVLIIDDTRLARAYLAEFRTVYNRARQGR